MWICLVVSMVVHDHGCNWLSQIYFSKAENLLKICDEYVSSLGEV